MGVTGGKSVANYDSVPIGQSVAGKSVVPTVINTDKSILFPNLRS